jgi:hypothetical protein
MESFQQINEAVMINISQIISMTDSHSVLQLNISRPDVGQCTQRLLPHGHFSVAFTCQAFADLSLQLLTPVCHPGFVQSLK